MPSGGPRPSTDAPPAVPPTWSARLRRYALAGLTRVGFEVVDVGPGAALLARRTGNWRRRLERDKALTEHLLREHVTAVLALYRVTCVLDVGANRGQYARMLRAGGYRGHIVSFEPVPEAFEQLAQAAEGDPRWTVHQLALGRADGVTTMHVVPGTLSSLLPPTRFGGGRYPVLREAATTEVQVRRLDGVLDAVTAHVRRPRLFLKMDTQGYDLEVFAGLGSRARELVGLQSEVALMRIYEGMPRMPEALAAYEAAGFSVTGLYQVTRQGRSGRVLELDCVMARASAL